MYIAIATQTFNLEGHLWFRAAPRTSLFNFTRRVSRTQTLDGGGFIDDRGFSHGDRNLDIVAKFTREDFDKIRNIAQNYSTVRVSFIDGVFLGSITSVSLNDRLETELQIIIGQVY